MRGATGEAVPAVQVLAIRCGERGERWCACILADEERLDRIRRSGREGPFRARGAGRGERRFGGGDGQLAEEAEGAVLVLRARRLLERRLARRDLEIVRDAVYRAQWDERHSSRLGVGNKRPARLQGDREQRDPGAEFSHCLDDLPSPAFIPPAVCI